MNIYQRIHAVMKQVDYIQKEKKMGMRYSIVSHDKVTAAVRPHMVDAGIVYFASVVERSQNGNRTEATVKVRFQSVDDPEDGFDVLMFGYGIDDQDKGPGKAISYAVKYALLKTLGLETGDDPDEDQDANHVPAPPQRATPPRQEVAKSPKIILRDKVIEWSGCKPEDANANCKRVFAACKLPENGKLTDEQINVALEWVGKCMKSNSPFDGAC